MGQPELAHNPDYSTHAARGANQRQLDALIGAWSVGKTRTEVLELMSESGVPAGLIYRAPEMLEDPHFQARDAIVAVPHPDFGEIRMQNVAPKLSETPGSIRTPSPGLGQHNEEIYLDLLGIGADRYQHLKSKKVI